MYMYEYIPLSIPKHTRKNMNGLKNVGPQRAREPMPEPVPIPIEVEENNNIEFWNGNMDPHEHGYFHFQDEVDFGFGGIRTDDEDERNAEFWEE